MHAALTSKVSPIQLAFSPYPWNIETSGLHHWKEEDLLLSTKPILFARAMQVQRNECVNTGNFQGLVREAQSQRYPKSSHPRSFRG